MDAVNYRLQAVHAGSAGALPAEENHFTAEREFRTRLKALAPHVWVTYALVVINVAVWLAMLIVSHRIAQVAGETLLAWGGNAASEVQRGQWWRLFTAMFVHSTPTHLLMNMLGLIGAGMMVERIYGHRLYLLLYLGSGLMGSALSLHFAAQTALSVGASGAIYGIAGALLVAVIQHRNQLPKLFGKQTIVSLGFFILYSLIQGFGKQGVDNSAHLGGLLAGCTLALILPERFDMELFIRVWKQRTSIAILALCVAVPGLTAMAPAAKIDQRKVIEGMAKFDQAFKHLLAKLRMLQQEDADIKAGKLDAFVADERNQTIHAKAFRQIYAELQQASLPPRDPRNAILSDSIRFTELMAEALAIPSVRSADGKKPELTDPTRMAAIESELKQLGLRMQKWGESMKAQSGR